MADNSVRREGRVIAVAAVLAVCLYALSAVLTEAPDLILFLNSLVLIGGTGLLVAYAPIGATALWSRRVTQGDWLAVGIMAFATAGVGARVMSIFARDLGAGYIYNTDLKSAEIALTGFGMVCFLVAPYAAGPALPRRRWALAAFLSMAGVAAALLVFALHHGAEPPLRIR